MQFQSNNAALTLDLQARLLNIKELTDQSKEDHAALESLNQLLNGISDLRQSIQSIKGH